MKKKVLVAQIGARMHYAIPVIFQNKGWLKYFITDFYIKNKYEFLLKLVAGNSRFKSINGRNNHFIPDFKIKNFNVFGIFYNLKLRFSKNRAEETKNYLWAGKKLCKNVKSLNFNDFNIFYGFNTDSYEVLKECKKHKVFSILEQTIASKRLHNQILEEEHQMWPFLEPSFNQDFVDEIIDRESKEWESASIIVCASRFVKESLISEGVEESKIHVIPYGVKKHSFKKIKYKKDYLDVIFVGSFGLRKGGIYFLEAAKQNFSKGIKFTVIGSLKIDSSVLDKYREYVTFTGPISRNEVENYYKNADVLCLPSLCEGSATVSYEALSYGVPLITTHNAGTVIEDGKEGFIVPIRDVEAINNAITKLKSNPELLMEMSERARLKSLDYTWEKYEKRLTELIEKKFNLHV